MASLRDMMITVGCLLSLFCSFDDVIAGEPAYVWEKVTLDAEFKPRDGAGAIVHDGKLWLIGGWNPRDKEFFPLICNNEVWSSTDGANCSRGG